MLSYIHSLCRPFFRSSKGQHAFGSIRRGLETLSDMDGIRANVDIVVIHDIDGDRVHSFTDVYTGVNWLCDDQLLPSELPGARILSYGYGASEDCQGASRPLRILDTDAPSLAEELYRLRHTTDTESRPIIFVAHGIGGILLQQALLYCVSTPVSSVGDYGTIRASTHGALFFGTPFLERDDREGTRALSVLMRASSNLDRMASKIPRNDLDRLCTLAAQYSSTYANLETICFYEDIPTRLEGRTAMLVPKSCAIMSRAKNTGVAIHKSHANMLKFSSTADAEYRKIVFYLQGMANRATDAVRQLPAPSQSPGALFPPSPVMSISRINNTSQSNGTASLLQSEAAHGRHGSGEVTESQDTHASRSFSRLSVGQIPESDLHAAIAATLSRRRTEYPHLLPNPEGTPSSELNGPLTISISDRD